MGTDADAPRGELTLRTLTMPAYVNVNGDIFGALIGAIAWNVITWYYGLPSSSSHALIGGMIGATIAKAGTGPLLAPGIVKTSAFIFVAPLLGMLLSGLLIVGVSWLCRRLPQRKTDRWFRRLQLLSSALYSVGHGSNDAQKTMGIIWLLLISAGLTTSDHLPNWVIVSCYLAIALGTADTDDRAGDGVSRRDGDAETAGQEQRHGAAGLGGEAADGLELGDPLAHGLDDAPAAEQRAERYRDEA